MARPKIEIDWEGFDKLCNLMCTKDEIAHYFNCSDDTISRAIKRKFKMSFAEYYKKKSIGGKISLRRAQFQRAIGDRDPSTGNLRNNGSVVMQIWLGKQYLGQAELPIEGLEEMPSGFDLAEI